ncbi:MAG: FG-GAP-like repeat-containing protein [Pirellulaceae bacterium]|nr:FG-GAP-like repeat-containing protein [Pirellulaceae bacterium]
MRHAILAVGMLSMLAGTVLAQDASYTPQWINREAEFPACGVMDVNHDGKLDIVSGGFWYEAPRWTKHFLREVEVIRGRFDDYSNLELDVNADGWTDIVSVNYRSKRRFWIEHPGEKIKASPDSPWTKHVIDTPGPMETGRLHDIDGDGKLDILPNGTDFAAWYELVQEKTAAGRMAPKFIKHDLPSEIAGHGVGFGDINGDGRGDIVGPRGWLEGPEDRRAGRWIWHPDWELTRDASIPILVHDVDSDGDNDLVWGRGHRYGLYWLEQNSPLSPRGSGAGGEGAAGTANAATSSWTRHAIDTSWSQPHSLLLADLDGDKQPEIIAGKRYLGHEGRDPGEYERIEHHAYSFDGKTRTFQRHKIAADVAGFGLDPQVVDIDGDGDLDFVAADRNGLSLIANHSRSDVLNTSTSLSSAAPIRPDRFHLLDDGTLGKPGTATPFAWDARRRMIKDGMEQVMGDLPDPSRRVPLDVQIESREETLDYVRIKLTYAAEPGDRVPALLLVPKSVKLDAEGLAGTAASKLPAMLCLHPTNVDGKSQTAGLVGEKTRHYGHQLAQEGFVCLIPDYPSFGEYKDYDFQQKRPGTDQPLYVSGTMKAIWNNIRAVDLLETLGYVDADKIGTIGHSLGGHNALYTAVFEPRLKCVATSCGFTAFHDYYKGNLKGWTSDRYMPRIRDVYENSPDKMPFDFPEVLAAIAPRGIYVAAPLADANFDNPGVRKCIAAAQPVFDLLGGKDQLVAEYPDCAHDFPDDVRERMYAWLKQQLK